MRAGCAVAALALVAAGCDTVPLTAPTGSALTISAASSVVQAGGSTEVTAFVYESSGTPVHNGTTVRFTTNLGRMEPAEAQTRNGYAVATFIAGETSGVADVMATSGSAGTGAVPGPGTGTTPPTTTSSNVVRITVGAAAADSVILNADPSSLPPGGGSAVIIASVLDANGNRLRNVPINFSTDAGTLSATVANTDANGEARVDLTTNREATVTARSATKTATVKVTINAPATVALSANPSSIPPGGGNVEIIALVLDAAGNRLLNVPVNFSTTTGTLSQTQVSTDANGEARVTLMAVDATTVTARAGTAVGTLQITRSGAITLTVTPSTGTVNTTTFTFIVTPAIGATNVTVDFGDGEVQNLGAITSPSSLTKKYSTSGTKVIRAEQTNIGGATSSAVVTVTVSN